MRKEIATRPVMEKKERKRERIAGSNLEKEEEGQPEDGW